MGFFLPRHFMLPEARSPPRGGLFLRLCSAARIFGTGTGAPIAPGLTAETFSWGES
jgi:hypothetical protein